jgi:heme-degrading monooxygenase HmoA
MAHPAMLVLVRFRSELSLDEIMKVAEERLPQFQALAGLQQKYYIQDVESGEFGGVYLWESPEALAEYRGSELQASIAAAYQTEGKPRVEIYRVVRPLRE